MDLFRDRLARGEHAESQVANDCGVRDFWPVLAYSMTTGYGASGRFGFGHPRVRDRFHRVGHSGFLSEEFVRKYWLPYLTAGTIVEGELDRLKAPWGLSVLTIVKPPVVMAAILGLAAWILWT
jgi:hypothetical protein